MIKRFWSLIVLYLLISGWLFVIDTATASAQQPDKNEEIVFLGLYGRIRVLDLTVLGEKQVAWFSPKEGFRDFVLGDVNADGDYEIIAIRGDGANGELVIYDPVVNSSTIGSDGQINGIPWKTLYEKTLGHTPNTVATGNLVSEVAADEIIYSLDVGGGRSELVILKTDSATNSGTSWQEHANVAFPRIWEDIAVGDIDNVGTDEIVLSDPDGMLTSRIEAYRIDNDDFVNRRPFFAKESDDRRWVAAAIGQVYPGGYKEVVTIRRATFQTPDNTFIFQYQPNASQVLTDVDEVLFHVDLKFQADLDENDLSDEFLQVFTDNGIDIFDPTITKVKTNQEWRIAQDRREIFRLDDALVIELNNAQLTDVIRQRFAENNEMLSEQAELIVEAPGMTWTIIDTETRWTYFIRLEDQELIIYRAGKVYRARKANVNNNGTKIEMIQVEERDSFFFAPRPQVLFLANINGTIDTLDDQEIFFLRDNLNQLDENNVQRRRLYMRNRGDTPTINTIEETLDNDLDGAGAGGDVDGDGEDELVIMRSNRIRTFLKPDENMTTWRDDIVNTNNRSLALADLDRNGFTPPGNFSDPNTLAVRLYLPLMLR